MSDFNYFHGDAGAFSFFRIPRSLLRDERFQALSVEAKLLYALMLDRMGLSLRSGWLDADNRVFIFYTLQEIQETLSCAHNKATRLLVELERFGLIERVRQGQGKPAKIYVKSFVAEEAPKESGTERADRQKSEKPTSGLSIFKPLDYTKAAGIYTDKSYNDFSNIYPIHPAGQTQPSGKRRTNGCDREKEAHPP